MKRVALFSAIALSVLSFTSCDKAAKLLFQPFESPLNFNVTVPLISSTDAETSMGSTEVSFNLDEEVKANTQGKVDGSVVGAMYLNQVAIELQNGNETNNLSNFEYVTLSVATGSSTPVVFGPFEIQPGTTNSATFTIPNSPNIKPYFNGATVQFTLRGKAKTATTQTLDARIGATIKFDK